MRENYPNSWNEEIPLVLWAYISSKTRSIGLITYSIVYKAEAILPVELAVPSARIALAHYMLLGSRCAQLESLDERRDKAKETLKVYTREL